MSVEYKEKRVLIFTQFYTSRSHMEESVHDLTKKKDKKGTKIATVKTIIGLFNVKLNDQDFNHIFFHKQFAMN